MSEIKPIFELLLWNNCNNACKFCHMHKNHHAEKFLTQEKRVDSLKQEESFLDSTVFIQGSHLLLVGGELFDTKFTAEVEQAFFSLIAKVRNFMLSGKIDLLYVNTNLIYPDLECLTWFLTVFQEAKLLPRIKFTTSYDLYGRFATETAENIMLNNLKHLTTKYGDDLHIVTNIIMTKQACEKILSGEFSVKTFEERYGVDVNMIPYIILTDDMAPTKEQIYNTLLNIDGELPGYLQNYLQNLALPQPKYLYEYNGTTFVYMTEENAACGHNKNFYLYQPDHKSCFICDMLRLKELD